MQYTYCYFEILAGCKKSRFFRLEKNVKFIFRDKIFQVEISNAMRRAFIRKYWRQKNLPKFNPKYLFPGVCHNKSGIHSSLIFMVFLFVDGFFGRLVYDQQ